jgi:peptide/nickel transport system ATP-binding protein
MHTVARTAPKSDVLVDIHDLRTYFPTEDGLVKAVDGVNLQIHGQRTVGIVGESGCGKSVTALNVMGLVPRPPAIIEGKILFHQKDRVIDILSLSPKGSEIRSIRGKEIAMIFQEPMTSLNPVYTIGNQIMESITLHQGVSQEHARELAIQLLDRVGIPVPERRVDEYPHQLSGGMRQRAMIAMALSCNPALLIADEPTTALDVTIQAQILELMQELQDEFETAIMLITHDLGVVAEMADDVAVMYLGQIVEHAPKRDLFKKHYHPYTEGLLQSVPRFRSIREHRLQPIEGMVPDGRHLPSGCRFAPRCPYSVQQCNEEPPVFQPEPNHYVRCWRYKEA